ncbi:MAG: hypothetical protein IJM88_04250 [Bacteroidales bacterium]|nr:hypothetical protein [Bacteroidales bacterium]
MKKVFSLLMMAAAMMAFVACEKEEEDNGSEFPQSLAQTAWHCDEPYVTIWLTDGSHAKFHQVSLGEHFNWNGTYTYDNMNGSGTMTFDVDILGPMTVTYTVKDDKMTVTQDGVQYVMDKIAYSYPGDKPAA